jgi:hypothetical protein
VSYTCPVCGYPDLKEPPRGETTGGSYEICPSCGIQFGYDDGAGGIDTYAREVIYKKWRKKWVEGGMVWKSNGIKSPRDWKPVEQLRNVEKHD